MLSNIPSPIKWIVGTGLAFVLLLILWLYFTKGVNGIQSFFFYKKANAEQAKVNAQLEKAKEQQAVIDQTLRDLAVAKEEIVKAKEARIEAEKIFDDKSKTAAQKLAAYEALMSGAPIVTDPGGVTMSDLCARAKAANSNPELIAALCAQ